MFRIGCPKNDLDIFKKNFENYDKLWIDVPKSFLDNLNNYNELYVSSQIQKIEEILDMINKKKDERIYNQIVNQQKNNAVKWCKDYSLPINKYSSYLK